jgi:acyl carrier protein
MSGLEPERQPWARSRPVTAAPQEAEPLADLAGAPTAATAANASTAVTAASAATVATAPDAATATTAATAADIAAADIADIAGRVKRLIVDNLHLEGLRPEMIDEQAPLFGDGLGLDSVDALELVVAVEKEFGIKIKSNEIGRDVFSSVASLARFIAGRV